MADREAHFLKAHLHPSEIDTGHGLRDLAAIEDQPRGQDEDDIRAIYAAAAALSIRDVGYASNAHQPRFEEYVATKEDRNIWGLSIMEMRKAALDGEIETVPERAVLLAAIVAFRQDVRAVRDFDEEHDSHLDLSNNAMLIYHGSAASENEADDWSRRNLDSIAKGRFDRIPDGAMPAIERMVSPDGMDQKLRHLALEAGRASERMTLGWGRRKEDVNLRVDDHSLAQIHREIGRGRAAGMAMARQQGMGMI